MPDMKDTERDSWVSEGALKLNDAERLVAQFGSTNATNLYGL